MSTMSQKQAGKAYSEIRKFNKYAGQLDDVTKESIALQLDLIQEEYLESVEAFDKENPVELLDGAIDMFVVVSGLLNKLEVSGYNVQEAMKRISDNNLSKFPVTPNNSFAKENGYNLVAITSLDGIVWSYRDSNGKLRKPPGFQAVDITDCVPKEFFK